MAREVFKGYRRPIRAKVPVAIGDGNVSGFAVVGHETFDIEVTVDLPRIAADLAQRAAGNRSGRAKFMHGAIVVHVIRRERE